MRPLAAVVASGVLLGAAGETSAADRKPPTRPVVTGPRVTSLATPVYRFSSRDRGRRRGAVRYRCSLDVPRLHACRARYVARLSVGTHLLRVRAVDAAGNSSPLARLVVTRLAVASPPPPPPPPASGFHRLTLSANGSGAVVATPPGTRCSSSCSADYASGSTVSLTVDAVEGNYFAGWGGDCAGAAASCTLTMDVDRNASAAFAPYNFLLAVTVAGNGRVADGYGRIDCPGLCSATYGFGAYVSLTASAAAGAAFDGWTGACSGAGSTCVVPMFGDQAVGASFSG